MSCSDFDDESNASHEYEMGTTLLVFSNLTPIFESCWIAAGLCESNLLWACLVAPRGGICCA